MMDAAFKELIDEIEARRIELSCSKTGAFYRGHSNHNYKLIPSLLRNQISVSTEHNLYHECYARAHRSINRNADSWEFLSFLQHHGVPTRLLDWSESLASALFFALGENHKNPHIWIINGFLINRSAKATDEPRILQTSLDPVPDYYECFGSLSHKEQWPYKKPIFIQIPWSSDRIAAQQGFFTVHNSVEPLDISYKKYVRKVSISEEAIPGVRRFLELSGTNEHTIFPGFDGLAMLLRKRYPV